MEFDVIIRMTSVRLGISEEDCKDIIMFHWKNVLDILSNCLYSKVRIKGFANFEIKRTFLKKQNYKLTLKYNSAFDEYQHYPSDKTEKLFQSYKARIEEFKYIYEKYWIEYAEA
jgi:nucleoid DNA-binding protein